MSIKLDNYINGMTEIPGVALCNYTQMIFDRQQSNSMGKENLFSNGVLKQLNKKVEENVNLYPFTYQEQKKFI